MQFIFSRMLLLGLLSLQVCVFAQDTITYYNDVWETICCKDSASFYRIGNNDHGIFDGEIHDYFLTGELQMEGYYKYWQQEGTFIWYYKNGGKMAVMDCNGEACTMMKGWDSLGVKTVKNGTGNFTWYSAFSKKPTSSGTYKNGKGVGSWVWYNPQGKRIEEVLYDENSKIISINCWDDAGEKQLVVNGTGTLIRHFKNGKMKCSVNWKDHKTEGKVTYYYENGQIKSEGSYLNGEQDGLWNYYYSNGQRSSSRIKSQGKDNGKITWWNSGGTMTCTGFFTNGLRTGLWIWFTRDGYEQSRFNY